MFIGSSVNLLPFAVISFFLKNLPLWALNACFDDIVMCCHFYCIEKQILDVFSGT